MADIAIFEDDAFSVPALTAAINEQEYLPGRISGLGLFREEGITTLTVQIEKDADHQTRGAVSYTHLTLPTTPYV